MEVPSNTIHGRLLNQSQQDVQPIASFPEVRHTANYPVHLDPGRGISIHSVPRGLRRAENRYSLSGLQRVAVFQELLAMEDPASELLLASKVRQEGV